MEKIQELLCDLLYEREISEIKEFISKTDDAVLLHMTAYNYNWDNGLEVAESIIANPVCDAGTALMIFENAERKAGKRQFYSKYQICPRT